MRIAAIYDIHSNLPALEAVIHDIRAARVDLIFVGGDVLPGPMPRETIAYLASFDIPTRFICGNGDREVLERMRGAPPDKVPERFRAGVQWVTDQLYPDDETLLAGWPKTHREHVAGLGDVLFCHATPRSDTEIFTKRTSEERLTPIFSGIGASIVVCGHTHMQFDRMIGNVRVVNAGSVGMPFGEPGAYWLLLGPDVTPRHTPYDLAKAADVIRATKHPDAEEFAARNILQPPSEEEVLAAFGRAELR